LKDGLPQTPSAPKSEKKLLDRELILFLWQALADMFGSFVPQHGSRPDPRNVWAAALAGLTREQIQRGLQNCADSNREHAPSAPVFRHMCMQKTSDELMTQGVNLLPAKVVTKDQRQKNREYARALIENRGHPDFEKIMKQKHKEIFG